MVSFQGNRRRGGGGGRVRKRLNAWHLMAKVLAGHNYPLTEVDLKGSYQLMYSVFLCIILLL